MGVSRPHEAWESKPLVFVLTLPGIRLMPKEWRKNLDLPRTQNVVLVERAVAEAGTGRSLGLAWPHAPAPPIAPCQGGDPQAPIYPVA